MPNYFATITYTQKALGSNNYDFQQLINKNRGYIKIIENICRLSKKKKYIFKFKKCHFVSFSWILGEELPK